MISKKWLLAAAVSANLFAYDSLEQQPFLQTASEIYHQLEKPPHWAFVMKGVQVQDSKMHQSGDRVRFNEADFDLYYTILPTCYETYTAGVGFGHTTLDWDQNPYFNEECFNVVKVGMTATTSRLNQWFWQASFYTDLNSRRIFSLGDARYTAQVWGRWGITPAVGFNIGLISITGLHNVEWYPILGIDYKPSCQWKLNIIFPTNLSVVYDFAERWSTSVSVRFFNDRQRVSEKAQPTPSAIFQYWTSGGEAGLRYDMRFLAIKGFLGCTTTSHLEIYNSGGNKLSEYEMKPSLYWGLNFSLIF